MHWLIIGGAIVLFVAAPPLIFGRCVGHIWTRLTGRR